MATKINLREFINVISKNVELGEGFDLSTIPEVELPENFEANFHNSYLTPLAAKNNDEVRSHYKGQYLSTIDNRTKAGFIASGGTEEAFNELKAQEPDSMKLIDLVLGEIAKLGSNSNAPSDNKEFEAYKIQTAKQIQDLLSEKEKFDGGLETALAKNNSEWGARLQTATITSKLAGFKFNDSMKREDAIYLTMKNVEDSPYILKLDENLNQRVYQKDNPENLAVNNGEDMTWDQVLEKYSYDYTKKNEQTQPTTKPTQTITAPVNKTVSDEEGRWIVGHPNYGK